MQCLQNSEMSQSRERVLLNALQLVVAQNPENNQQIYETAADLKQCGVTHNVWSRVRFWNALLGSH